MKHDTNCNITKKANMIIMWNKIELEDEGRIFYHGH